MPKVTPEKTCSCGTPIAFIRYQGKKHPINAKPEKRFVFVPGAVNDGDNFDEVAESGGTWCLKDTHVSHFAECPEAEKFRKGPR